MSVIQKIALMSVMFINPVLAQWEVNGSFNYKSEIPNVGLGIGAARNLPFQWPTIGFKVRAGIDLFRSTEIQTENGVQSTIKFSSEDFHVDLIATLFYRYIKPYFGLSMGVGHYSVNQFNEYMFFLGALVGAKFTLAVWIHLFIEVDSYKYFSSFNTEKTKRNISSLQFIGRAGIIFKF
ncbi:MAG: hypothetical protein IH950_03225 [Bacteroidetes bacterium]|nr:hypothetical protein [Bacteroidota bacterium]